MCIIVPTELLGLNPTLTIIAWLPLLIATKLIWICSFHCSTALQKDITKCHGVLINVMNSYSEWKYFEVGA
jgi:hypothetical protein